MKKHQKQLIAVIILTMFADFLFYYQVIGGMSLSLYNLAILVCIAFCEEKFYRDKKVIAIALINITLIIASIIHANFWSISLSVLSLFSIMIVIHSGWLASTIKWIEQWFFSTLFFLFSWIDDMHFFVNWVSKLPEKNIIGWIIAIVFSGIFVLLFAIANPIIEVWVNHLQKVELFGTDRFIFWCLFALFSWSFLRLTKKRMLQEFIDLTEANDENVEENNDRINVEDSNDKENDENVGENNDNKEVVLVTLPIFTPNTTVLCLRMFNIVFAIQTVLDIIYLWGGSALPEGMSYAEYAHRGSYPLIFTVLLAAVFVLITFRKKREDDMDAARFWVYIWLIQNVFLVISSVLRLDLYIEFYHLTRWRIAALIWMGLIAVGLLFILIRIIKDYSNLWLININFIAVLCVFYLCAFVNFDAYIANYNVANVENTDIVVDVEYLENLGIESLPALYNLKEKGYNVEESIKRLREKLILEMSNWRSWSYYNASVYNLHVK
ncbi:DUF4173 domain-containing protein [Candidatus Uabimicrobium sp. HlEnr_7]|uniref:DUF4153 domain-containing protein n=1 Tax=Candidatus Uabimicrobium helgolandensis TaxID=3095367 RepID=UPI00355918BA